MTISPQCSMIVPTINHEEEEQCSKAAGHHPLEDINYTLVRGFLNLLQDLNLNNGRCSTAAESQNVAGYTLKKKDNISTSLLCIP